MGSIKYIILDLGGVIIDLDYDQSITAFEKLGIDDFRTRYTQAAQSPVFDAYEKGRISSAEFREHIRQLVSLNLDDHSIDTAWNSMLIGLPDERISFLRRLALDFPLYLLSNTNEIHIQAFTGMLLANQHSRGFEEIFRKVYYSCRMGMRKPDAEIFDFVLKENNLDARETLFIDDSPQHIRGALACGIQARHLDVQSGQKLEERFDAILSGFDYQ